MEGQIQSFRPPEQSISYGSKRHLGDWHTLRFGTAKYDSKGLQSDQGNHATSVNEFGCCQTRHVLSSIPLKIYWHSNTSLHVSYILKYSPIWKGFEEFKLKTAAYRKTEFVDSKICPLLIDVHIILVKHSPSTVCKRDKASRLNVKEAFAKPFSKATITKSVLSITQVNTLPVTILHSLREPRRWDQFESNAYDLMIGRHASSTTFFLYASWGSRLTGSILLVPTRDCFEEHLDSLLAQLKASKEDKLHLKHMDNLAHLDTSKDDQHHFGMYLEFA